jgi:hypothetical protein
VLLAISQLALAGSLTACGGSPEESGTVATAVAGDTDLELLASVAYDLMPFPALAVQLYISAAEQLLQSGSPVIAEGLAQLRTASGALPWKEVDESLRLSILATMEGSAFFASVRAATITALFRSPDTFALVGYGGSAIEHGGYINRGFADINWLPQE